MQVLPHILSAHFFALPVAVTGRCASKHSPQHAISANFLLLCTSLWDTLRKMLSHIPVFIELEVQQVDALGKPLPNQGQELADKCFFLLCLGMAKLEGQSFWFLRGLRWEEPQVPMVGASLIMQLCIDSALPCLAHLSPVPINNYLHAGFCSRIYFGEKHRLPQRLWRKMILPD